MKDTLQLNHKLGKIVQLARWAGEVRPVCAYAAGRELGGELVLDRNGWGTDAFGWGWECAFAWVCCGDGDEDKERGH